jgi:hypothetical protein
VRVLLGRGLGHPVGSGEQMGDDIAQDADVWLDDGGGSWGPAPPPNFQTTDWLIASGTTAIVAVCICAGIVSMRPWNDASLVRAIDGCAFKTLAGQNWLDAILSLVFLGTRTTEICVSCVEHPPAHPPMPVSARPQCTRYSSEWRTTRIRPCSCRYSSLLASLLCWS